MSGVAPAGVVAAGLGGLGAGPGLDLILSGSFVGSAAVSADAEKILDSSGYLVGSGVLLDETLLDAGGAISGGSSISADAQVILGASGYLSGQGAFAFSVPDPIVGVGILTAHMEVIHVSPPICQQPVVTTAFRWGHVFTRGDLMFKVVDGRGNPFGPVCITYTLYQMQPGCVLKQIGPSGRKPATAGVGCYYVTGTAGECGQPGLWAVRWQHQRIYGDPVVESDCYFQVQDSVSCPIPGDTLERYCKFGWD
jgi:hypothetical protein